ncbi:MAG: DedA family protein, partial [Bdellovibrionales bacterium]|nr:DedA family protein [Bdellovibrionales bacterium]
GVGMAGVLIGDSLVYFLGRIFGKRLMKRWPFRVFIDDGKIEGIRVRLHEHGAKLLFSARFMPGVRSTVFFAAGLLHYPYRKMIFFDGLAAILSVPAIVYSVYHFGDFLESVIKWIKKVEGGIVALIVVSALVFGYRFWSRRRKKNRISLNQEELK